MAMRTPGQEFRHGLRKDFIFELFDDKIIDRDKIRCMKSKFGKEQVNAIHSKRKFIPQFRQIRLAKRRSVTNDEGTLAFVNIF